MVGDPTMTAAGATLSSILKFYDGYLAYKGARIKETDKGLRDDIERRIFMIGRHLDTLEARYLADKDAAGIVVIERMRTSLASFGQDVRLGAVGSTEQSSSVKSLKKGQVRTLIGHDHAVLSRLVEATRMVNQLLDSQAKGEDTGTLLPELEQKIVGVQNRFSDRSTFISKL